MQLSSHPGSWKTEHEDEAREEKNIKAESCGLQDSAMQSHGRIDIDYFCIIKTSLVRSLAKLTLIHKLRLKQLGQNPRYCNL
jgi:hypothetical protein